MATGYGSRPPTCSNVSFCLALIFRMCLCQHWLCTCHLSFTLVLLPSSLPKNEDHHCKSATTPASDQLSYLAPENNPHSHANLNRMSDKPLALENTYCHRLHALLVQQYKRRLKASSMRQERRYGGGTVLEGSRAEP
jgi:hypothetical protein